MASETSPHGGHNGGPGLWIRYTAAALYVLQVNLSLPLSTITAGSTHVPQTRAIFEVKKGGSQQESSNSQPTAEMNKETDILSVTIFRELRGCSEIAIFLSSSPVRSMKLCVCVCL